MYDCLNELSMAVEEVFKTMVFLQVRVLADLTPVPWPPDILYSSMVGLSGDESGVVYFLCDGKFAYKTAESMLRESIKADHECVIDAMGEVANMIGGCFKNKVDRFKDYRLSLPSVVVGKNFSIHTPGGAETKTLGFECDGSHFMIQLVLKT